MALNCKPCLLDVQAISSEGMAIGMCRPVTALSAQHGALGSWRALSSRLGACCTVKDCRRPASKPPSRSAACC